MIKFLKQLLKSFCVMETEYNELCKKNPEIVKHQLVNKWHWVAYVNHMQCTGT